MSDHTELHEVFSDVALTHPLWNHEFLVRCREGHLAPGEIKILAGQMYNFCKEFNRILASSYLQCADERVRMVIAEILFDEMGKGDPEQTHAELFRRFTREIGITDEELEELPMTLETQEMIDTYIKLPEEHGYLAGLGALCYGSEGIVSTLYAHLIAGIDAGASLSKEALAFFEMYSELDCNHARALARVITSEVEDATTKARIMLAITDALDARQKFYDGVQRSAESFQKAAREASRESAESREESQGESEESRDDQDAPDPVKHRQPDGVVA